VDALAERLGSLVAPLVNDEADRQMVNHGLGAITERAWNISATTLRSRMGFNYVFPDVGSRFLPMSMVLAYPESAPGNLNSYHYRVRLVASPVVTARNATGVNVAVFAIMNAEVILMK